MIGTESDAEEVFPFRTAVYYVLKRVRFEVKLYGTMPVAPSRPYRAISEVPPA